MTDTTTAPVATLTMTEVPAEALKTLAEPAANIVPYEAAEAEEKQRIEALIGQLDMHNTQSIIAFGVDAQRHVTEVSETMLEGVRNKDTGPAGEALNNMMLKVRGLDIEDLKDGKKPGWLARLFGAISPVARFVQQYETVGSQIESLSGTLEGHKQQLLKDILLLDRLYDTTLDYFHTLADYIAAGDEKLRRLDADEIPALAKIADESGDMVDAQKLRDLRSARDELERRVHDLKLTRQVTMQSLPSIRLVQENDKMLVNKIQSSLLNTIPLWKTQLAQAVTMYRAAEAGETVKAVHDLNNELLAANAANLRTSNAQIREQMERGVYDIEVIKKANDELIATIQDSIRIAEEGKAKRAAAERELADTETKLKTALKTAAQAAA
ncbi:MAG: toxic anion resistance protein [Alphaproteobacteria bacterium]